MSSFKLKVCGLRDADNIADIAALRPEFMGFIFVPSSSRYVGGVLSARDLKCLSDETVRVGVFRNALREEIIEQVEEFSLGAIQLHGDESPELCASFLSLGKVVIKSFSVRDDFEWSQVAPFEGTVTHYLFDSGNGGTGKLFNWDKIRDYKSKTSCFIAGGIGAIDVPALYGLRDFGVPIYALDVNSSVEILPGLKSVSKVQGVVGAIRRR